MMANRFGIVLRLKGRVAKSNNRCGPSLVLVEASQRESSWCNVVNQRFVQLWRTLAIRAVAVAITVIWFASRSTCGDEVLEMSYHG